MQRRTRRVSPTSVNDPSAIAITPDGKTALVANWTEGTVTPVTLSTMTAGTPVTVGNQPAAIAITPDGTKAYVANYNGNGSGHGHRHHAVKRRDLHDHGRPGPRRDRDHAGRDEGVRRQPPRRHGHADHALVQHRGHCDHRRSGRRADRRDRRQPQRRHRLRRQLRTQTPWSRSPSRRTPRAPQSPGSRTRRRSRSPQTARPRTSPRTATPATSFR